MAAVQSKLETVPRRTRAFVALVVLALAMGHKQIVGLTKKRVHLLKLHRHRKRLHNVSLDQGLEQLYYRLIVKTGPST